MDRPVVVQQILEVVIVPSSGVSGPRSFKSRGYGINPDSAATISTPRVLLVLAGRETGTFGAGAVGLSKGMSSTYQSDSLGVVHGHASESVPNLGRRNHRIGLSHGSLGVHVDQPHSGCTEGTLTLSVRGAGGKDLLLGGRTKGEGGGPIDIIDAPKADAEGRSTH